MSDTALRELERKAHGDPAAAVAAVLERQRGKERPWGEAAGGAWCRKCQSQLVVRRHPREYDGLDLLFGGGDFGKACAAECGKSFALVCCPGWVGFNTEGVTCGWSWLVEA